MKRLLILVATSVMLLVLCAAPAWAANPAWVQSDGAFTQTVSTTATQTDTLTHTTTAGNLIAVFVQWKTTTRTLTSVTATNCQFLPYLDLKANGSTAAGQVLLGINCPAISSIVVTLSGGSVFTTLVEEYSGVLGIGQMTTATGTSTHPSISLTTQDSNNVVIMGSASLGNDGIPTSSVGNLRDANRTGSTSSHVAGAACDNSSASPASVTCTVTITSSAWVAFGIELRSVNPASTDHVQSFATNTQADQGAGPFNHYAFNMPQATLAGNTIICGMRYPYNASRTVAFSDDKSNSWTNDKLVNNGTTWTEAVWRVQAATGTQKITITFDASFAFDLQFSCHEFEHIKAASPVDVTCSTTGGSAPSVSCGSMTTTVNDLVFNWGDYSGGGNINNADQCTGYAAPGAGFVKLLINPVTSMFSQYQIDTSPGAVNPSIYVNSTGTEGETCPAGISMDSIGVAYELDNAQGTAPGAGIHIDREALFVQSVGSNLFYDCPSTGNLSAFVFSNGTPTMTITDSQQNSYSTSDPSSLSSVLYAQAAANSNSGLCKVHEGTGGGTDEGTWYDISGAATSGVFLGTTNNSGTQGAAGAQINDAPDYTPTASGNLVLVTLQMGIGPPSAFVSPTGAVFDSVHYDNQTDNQYFSRGEGYGHIVTTGTTALAWNWSTANATASAWSGVAWEFKAAPTGGGGGQHNLLLMGCCGTDAIIEQGGLRWDW